MDNRGSLGSGFAAEAHGGQRGARAWNTSAMTPSARPAAPGGAQVLHA